MFSFKAHSLEGFHQQCAETDAFRVGIVLHLDRVTIEDRDDGADETSECSYWVEQEQ